MKNILSYPVGTVFSGQEINEWLDDQIKNHRGNFKVAMRLHQQYRIGLSRGLAADSQYQLVRMLFHTKGPSELGFLRVKNLPHYLTT